MKVQNTMRKIVALSAGAAMVGATMMGALAYTLADYPSPFVAEGASQAKIVVGAAAMTADMLGAVDIATSLQQAAVSPASAGTTTVTVVGGQAEEVPIGTSLHDATDGFGTTLDNTDLPFLADSSMSIDIGDVSNTYDFEEQILFTGSALATVETALTLGSDHDDFGDKVFLTTALGAVEYRYVFTEDLQTGNFINDSTNSDPIYLDFMGRELKVVGATATTITVQVGTEFFMAVDDTVEVDGKEVRLSNVGSNGAVVVSVDGVQKTISEDSTANVNGLRVRVQDTFYSDTLTERSATLVIGEEATKTYSDEEAFITEDEDLPAWRWNLASLNTASPTIGVVWDVVLNSYSGSDIPGYEHPIYVGESINLPYDYAQIELASLNQENYQTYKVTGDATKTLYYGTSGTGGPGSTGDLIQIEAVGASNSGLLTVTGGEKTDKIWLYAVDNETVGVYYWDNSNSRAVLDNNYTITNTNTDGAALFNLDYGKSNVPAVIVDYYGTAGAWIAGNLTFNFTTTDFLKVPIGQGSADYDMLGWDNEDTDSGLFWYDGSAATGIASMEENQRTSSGVVIKDPDSVFQKSSGYVEFDLPADVTDFKANVVITGTGTTTSGGSVGGAVEVNPIAVGLAILDTNANLGSGDNKYIVVGGPCVNTVAAELMGNPESCAEGFEEGKALIKLFSTQNALLVAGYSAADTQGASRVLANYGMYADDFTGTELEVITTNLNNLQVNPQ